MYAAVCWAWWDDRFGPGFGGGWSLLSSPEKKATQLCGLRVVRAASRLCRHSAPTPTPFNASVLSRVFWGKKEGKSESRIMVRVASSHPATSSRRPSVRKPSAPLLFHEDHQPRHSTLLEARPRLYRYRCLQPNTYFATYFEIYKMI